MLSGVVGVCPARNRSVVDRGQSAVGCIPDGTQTRARSSPGGSCHPCTGKPSTPLASTRWKIGAAVMDPSASFIGLLSLLPVHTPTASCGV